MKQTDDEVCGSTDGQRGVYVGCIQKVRMRWVAPHLLNKVTKMKVRVLLWPLGPNGGMVDAIV